MTRRLREIDMPFSQLQCLWWVEGLLEDSLLPSSSLTFKTCNLCIIKQTFFSSLSLVVLTVILRPADRLKPQDFTLSSLKVDIMYTHAPSLPQDLPVFRGTIISEIYFSYFHKTAL